MKIINYCFIIARFSAAPLYVVYEKVETDEVPYY